MKEEHPGPGQANYKFLTGQYSKQRVPWSAPQWYPMSQVLPTFRIFLLWGRFSYISFVGPTHIINKISDDNGQLTNG